MTWKMPKTVLQLDENVSRDRYRRHPLLWLASYLIGLVLVVALAVDWLWVNLMSAH